MKRYPIGVQDFFHFREDGYCYVDKTERIHDLITTSGKAVFLARPRRFGKSLLCSTLAAIFEARRELFDGLAIDKTNYDWKKYPVLRIDLNAEDYSKGVSHLEIPINTSIELCAKKYAVPFEGQSVTDRFHRLLVNLHNKYNERVVVIIDEYDKPLLVTMDNPELQAEIRGALKP
ncbi:MAG: AAA family ATPase, partial [Planctomycetaceae bacterium]|nr:AAA family ATPase [Planctomycetaceae bacterium]